MSLRLSSILFILFPLFYSSEIISTILCSMSVIFLLPQLFCYCFLLEYFNFSNCVSHYLFVYSLFFSTSLVIILTVLFLAFSPFYFQVFGTSLLSLFWIPFQVDCLFPLHLFFLVSFYLILSFVLYSSVFPCFFLTCSIWSLLFTGFIIVFLLPFGFCPWRERLVEWFALTFC